MLVDRKYVSSERHVPLNEDVAEVFLLAAEMMSQSLPPEQAIGGLLRLLADRLHLDKGRVVLPDRDSGMLSIRYAHDLSAEERARGIYAVGEGVTGRLMRDGGVALVPDVSAEPEYVARVFGGTAPRGEGMAFIAVPILQDGNPVGVLAVNATDDAVCGFEGGLYVLQVLAAMIGQILRIDDLSEREGRPAPHAGVERRRGHAGVGYGILGTSQALRQAQQQALRAASSDATVMLMGESGTGKEKFARMIHVTGARRDKPFVCINCATIPEHLLESELFGHEKGSFTGATDTRPGKFELASGGTLFLDEIGDMDIDLQAKLLRALQEKSIQRIGGRGEIPVDVRIITATHKNLQELVNGGEFRLDLYYRLNVIAIELPALRERKGDIRLLASYFMNRENQRYGRNVVLADGALDLLEQYDWPGNIRQLENVIERMVVMTDAERVPLADVERILQDEARIQAVVEYQPLPDAAGRPYARVREQERQMIETALQQARGNKTQAAKRLGLTARQLHYRLAKLSIRG
jgi:Nif-specific regulatory protein